MKWKKTELDKYVQAKEYVDTILLPLIPFQMGSDKESEKSSFQNEVINIFANEIEKELSGRVMLAPNYYFLKTTDKAAEIDRLNSWIQDIKEQPFEHIVLLTFDAGWKKHEKSLNGNILWLPGMQSGDLRSKETAEFIRDQISQISEMIRSYW